MPPCSRGGFAAAYCFHVPQIQPHGPPSQRRIVAVPLDQPQPVAELEFMQVLLGRACSFLPPDVADGIGAPCAQWNEVIADEAGTAMADRARGGAGHGQREGMCRSRVTWLVTAVAIFAGRTCRAAEASRMAIETIMGQAINAATMW